MTESHAPARRRAPGRIGWLLAVSACLNVLLLGFAAGAVLRHRDASDALGPAIEARLSLRRVYRALDAEGRAAARAALAEARPRLAALAEVRQEARLALAAALEAEPVSPDALASALAAARRPARESRAIAEAAFVRFAVGLPADRRREMAEALRDDRHGRRRRSGLDGDRARDGADPLR